MPSRKKATRAQSTSKFLPWDSPESLSRLRVWLGKLEAAWSMRYEVTASRPGGAQARAMLRVLAALRVAEESGDEVFLASLEKACTAYLRKRGGAPERSTYVLQIRSLVERALAMTPPVLERDMAVEFVARALLYPDLRRDLRLAPAPGDFAAKEAIVTRVEGAFRKLREHGADADAYVRCGFDELGMKSARNVLSFLDKRTKR